MKIYPGKIVTFGPRQNFYAVGTRVRENEGFSIKGCLDPDEGYLCFQDQVKSVSELAQFIVTAGMQPWQAPTR